MFSVDLRLNIRSYLISKNGRKIAVRVQKQEIFYYKRKFAARRVSRKIGNVKFEQKMNTDLDTTRLEILATYSIFVIVRGPITVA